MSTESAANMEDEVEKDINDTSGVAEDSNASTAAVAPKKPRPRIDTVDVDWLFSDQGDSPFVTIKCGDDHKSFVVLKSILTRNSDFFQKCLNEPWTESRSSTVHLPDVKPEYMELYLRLATRQALLNTALQTESLVQLHDFLCNNRLVHFLMFYKTCDYLQNRELAKGVQDLFFEFMRNHTSPKVEERWKPYFQTFAHCFDLLEPGHTIQRRLQRFLVKIFCDRVSSEIYFTHCKVLKNRHAFVFEVTQQFALNAMWKDASTKAKADKHKTQRMSVDDDSEAEE
ncbi:hypothetical protein CkaCkLH20_11053 [Colletotrichum karsti]|uniref:BTB domain-containing protein n=1 Tax=Colletotrichum karsti TaxID=1095194 RepID=A0A9P6HYF7_9PEZI|nr:uncharacterized protein CkaCkLH20_11053 [Colletotrichum karsti]KAF9871406.1 hypothetical protein CkaCkLH20_11053 [Colletotrichum karsti]